MAPSAVQVLDGATGTELSRRGLDVSSSLFSARAVLEAPHIIEAIHREYLEAGVDAITTATFRTHRRSLAKAGLGERAADVTREAVELALKARDAVNADARVLGSVGPLEDCYHPQAAPRDDICAYEHGEMISTLLDSGVDGVLLETIGTMREAAAAASQAEQLATGRWSMSFIAVEGDSPGTLLDGESLVDLLPSLHDAQYVGVNCIAAPSMGEQVRLLRTLLPEHVGIMAFANVSRREDDGTWLETDAADPQRYAEYAKTWVDNGATLIGGCCGTTPQTIRVLVESFNR